MPAEKREERTGALMAFYAASSDAASRNADVEIRSGAAFQPKSPPLVSGARPEYLSSQRQMWFYQF